jgi:cell wall-associated NlpC family hydrolase
VTRAAALTLALALAGCATVPARSGPSGGLPPLGPGAQASEDAAPAPGEAATSAGGEAVVAGDAAEAAPTPAAGTQPRDRAETDRTELGARLAADAATLVGRRGPFVVAGERFNDDCSGLVAAVFAAEGIDLRAEMQHAAPGERGSARATWLAARERGETFGAEATPEPGDLVFWNDTYDRNRNGKVDDPLTHVGIVERVDGETVTFVHRGGRGVARGVMTLAHRHAAADEDGHPLNSTVRTRAHPARRGGLAAELFAGFARLDLEPSRAAAELHARASKAPARRGRAVAAARR